MTWELRNVGWPVPYGEPWPISSKSPKSQESQIQTSPTKHIIVVYGYNWFATEAHLGQKVNVWV